MALEPSTAMGLVGLMSYPIVQRRILCGIEFTLHSKMQY